MESSMNRVKFLSVKVVFQEIPDEITLAINLTQCPHTCNNCHSPELRSDKGEILIDRIEDLIKANSYITCICFMGGDRFKNDIIEIAKIIKNFNLKVAVYSGDDILYDPYIKIMDYYKIGSYKEEFGPLNNKNTNQILYKIVENKLENITYKFWRKE